MTLLLRVWQEEHDLELRARLLSPSGQPGKAVRGIEAILALVAQRLAEFARGAG